MTIYFDDRKEKMYAYSDQLGCSIYFSKYPPMSDQNGSDISNNRLEWSRDPNIMEEYAAEWRWVEGTARAAFYLAMAEDDYYYPIRK